MTYNLEKGIAVEMEHKATYTWLMKLLSLGRVPSVEELAQHIAMDHIAEHKDYYDYLEIIESVMKKQK